MADFFILNEEILKLQDSCYFFPNEVSINDLDEIEIDKLLNDAVDIISENPFAITNEELFDTMRSFVKNVNSLKPTILNRVLDIIISGFQSEYTNTSNDLDFDDEETYSDHQIALEMYGFLLFWFITNAERKATSKSNASGETITSGGTASKRKTKRTRQTRSKVSSNNNEDWDWSTQKQEALDLMIKVLEPRIKKIWDSTHEIEIFVSLFTNSAYRMLENITTIKTSSIKTRVYTVLSICVKEYNHAFGAQTTIIQNLQYYEHLSEPMAEFLQVLVQQHDHTQLVESTLIEISDKEFNSQDTIGPKSFSKFLIKLSALVPKVVVKQIVLLRKHLESDSHTMRCGLIEVIGNLIIDLAQQEENAPNNMHQVNGFFDVLDERFLDLSSYCRLRVLQVYFRICDLSVKFPKRRQKVVDLVIRCLEDKASIVRKNAIKLLTKFISTHPYGIMHGGELSAKEWEERLRKVEVELKAIQPPQELAEIGAEALDEVETADEDIEMTEVAVAPHLSSSDELEKLQMTKRYYADAVRFIHQIYTAIPTICQLLASTTKTEVIEAIEFFETAQLYKIEEASEGIKKMLHLIWTKDNNDEGKGIRKRLIEGYRKLYIEPDISLSEKENVNIVTRNLISLTFNATLAELTSLEQLLSTIMKEDDVISDYVINKLWLIYASSTKDISKEQRCGAIIVLSMLAKAKTEIVQEKIDLLLKVGLGQFGKADLVLAKYTCIALQRLSGDQIKVKGSLANNSNRISISHQIFHKLKQIIELQTTSQEWFRVAEQAINTIYLLGDHPDVLCGDIIKRKVSLVFDLKIPCADGDMEIDEGENILTNQEPFMTHPLHLSQLLFIVGHVAIKQIVHLEVIEADWKRKKENTLLILLALIFLTWTDKEKSVKNTTVEDELDQVVGTTEDEFVEAIAQIREKELLFGPDSLLTVFGPLIVNICSNNKTYNHRNLQIAATLALAKLMCVSSEFCENNLQLLFTILERSNEPTIRSNIIIALGDLTVCFNSLIDQNINYLYKRLADPDNMVKKNTLMVLTHLILNGMIKVKGYMWEVAKCLEDKERRISDLAKLFFTELASKDNSVYNNLPDIISNFTSGENPVNEESFKKIMKFLFDFIEKDKQTESLIEKLFQRFDNLHDKRQWRDIAQCLSLLPYKNEKSLKKLTELITHYQNKLQENDVYKYFTDIVAKAKVTS
ncbi:11563_t:CDS:10 [Funneliformis geosporum]|uniref:Condensin complex subunit 1 n=1 Tax=Funneliformis geosporum TaxID=1117311 RepID=A0A9W4STY0_9GLOM|nr:11563_t:CDS:10 [Funneliformis geosporum]